MATSVAPISFGAVLAILGAATVVGVGVAVVLHLLLLIPVVLAVVLVVGVVFILATASNEPPAVAGATPTADEEPFEDPVEEADRLESSGASPTPSVEGADAEPAAAPPSAASSEVVRPLDRKN